MNIKRLKIALKDRVLVDINFTIDTSLALVGESGSGKSLTLKALLNMLPDSMEFTLESKSDFTLKAGDSISFVPQNPFTSLSPLTKIKNQFFVDDKKKVELLNSVGLDEELLDRFPPELSGGQLQRVVIAISLESYPKLLLLDEPTTALDPKTRVKILKLLKDLQVKYKFKILLVTHDISAAESLCEDISVIKGGKLIENGKMAKVLQNPQEEYTKVLIDANFANRKFRE